MTGRAALPLPAGADPALNYPRPDFELLLYQTVQPLGGTVTWAYSATEGDPPGWLFTAHVQVDCRASSRADASARADQARRAICALPAGSWPGGVVNSVEVTEGPLWAPDPDGAPRYVARYAVTGHPVPASGLPKEIRP